MYRIIFTLSLLLVSTLLSAELYRWTDEKGNVHFSDKPLNDQSELYTPPPLQTVPAGPTGSFTPKAKTAKFKYESISISSPANDAIFTPDTKSISVSIQLSPALNSEESHSVALYMDGQLHSEGESLSYSFASLPRGKHTVYAVVKNAKGKKLKSSDPVSFYVQRHHL